MGAEPAAVYRTTDPAILAAWDAEMTRRKTLYGQAVTFADTIDPDQRRNLVGAGREAFIGLSHQADWPIPTGWRLAGAASRWIVPNPRTKAGREAAKHLARLSPGNPLHVLNVPDHGLPGPFFDARSRFIEPGVLRTGDALYTAWVTDPADPAATEWTNALEQHEATCAQATADA